ncbi:hypothetical protein [Sagittula salina]|uniref:Phasin domain-containing protein n=1 Tax=Sagittula salina TaxID=2820268 RepID=A0A940S0F0_9RHOB|nr:hypothetical protein [Sagittula salina]MBP0483003.1 hypothetical protein [Sagittula salina]
MTYAMFLPQQMMLTSMQMMQTFFTTYVEASQRLMQQGAESAEEFGTEAMQATEQTAEAVNWEGQEALRRATNEANSAMPL